MSSQRQSLLNQMMQLQAIDSSVTNCLIPQKDSWGFLWLSYNIMSYYKGAVFVSGFKIL